MRGGGEPERVVAPLQAGERRVHRRALEVVDHRVQQRQQLAEVGTAAQRDPGRALDHPHQQAGADAVAGDVDDVGGPAGRVLDDVDQVAADLAAGHRQAAQFDRRRPLRQRRHEHAMDLPRELDLRLQPAVA